MALSGSSLFSVDNRRRELFAVVVANAIPLIGVGVLGWDISALVVLYWVELAVIFFFGGYFLFCGHSSPLRWPSL